MRLKGQTNSSNSLRLKNNSKRKLKPTTMTHTTTNWGAEAELNGRQDADNIFKLHGIKVIKQISAYSLRDKDDYGKGKIERSKQIVQEHSKTLKP